MPPGQRKKRPTFDESLKMADEKKAPLKKHTPTTSIEPKQASPQDITELKDAEPPKPPPSNTKILSLEENVATLPAPHIATTSSQSHTEEPTDIQPEDTSSQRIAELNDAEPQLSQISLLIANTKDIKTRYAERHSCPWKNTLHSNAADLIDIFAQELSKNQHTTAATKLSNALTAALLAAKRLVDTEFDESYRLTLFLYTPKEKTALYSLCENALRNSNLSEITAKDEHTCMESLGSYLDEISSQHPDLSVYIKKIRGFYPQLSMSAQRLSTTS